MNGSGAGHLDNAAAPKGQPTGCSPAL